MKILHSLFNIFFLISLSVLVLFSVLAIVVIHYYLFFETKPDLSLHPKVIEAYLSSFASYKSLFAGTVALLACYFGFHRLKAAEIANRDKVKNDYFNEWKLVLETRVAEIEKSDPFMKREFIMVRYKLFQLLYDTDFRIKNKKALESIFNKTFKERVRFIEEQNNRQIGMGGVYQDNQYSYSFNNFRFLFIGSLISYDNAYDGIENDLKNLFLNNLDPDRRIDINHYRVALQNYKPIV